MKKKRTTILGDMNELYHAIARALQRYNSKLNYVAQISVVDRIKIELMIREFGYRLKEAKLNNMEERLDKLESMNRKKFYKHLKVNRRK